MIVEEVGFERGETLDLFKGFKNLIDKQYGNPKGLVGLYIGEKMVQQHQPETKWTINLLAPKQDDTILELGCGAGYAIKQIIGEFHVNYLVGWYAAYSNDLYKYAFFMINEHELAKDIVQETFIRAFNKIDTFQGEHVKSWLFRIARNVTIDHIRKNKPIAYFLAVSISQFWYLPFTIYLFIYLKQNILLCFFRHVDFKVHRFKNFIKLIHLFSLFHKELPPFLVLFSIHSSL